MFVMQFVTSQHARMRTVILSCDEVARQKWAIKSQAWRWS